MQVNFSSYELEDLYYGEPQASDYPSQVENEYRYVLGIINAADTVSDLDQCRSLGLRLIHTAFGIYNVIPLGNKWCLMLKFSNVKDVTTVAIEAIKAEKYILQEV